MHFSLNWGSFALRFGHLPRPTVYLVRHGQSLSNVDRDVHNRLPDPLIPLSPLGERQPVQAGIALGNHLAQNGQPKRIRVFHSEYKRAEQTCLGLLEPLQKIGKGWGATIDHRADSRIHELEFGWVSGLSDEDRKAFLGQMGNASDQSKLLRKHGAKFFDRRAGGESPADVEVRLRHFFGALYRDVEENGITHFVVVSHGLTNRVFAKAWLGESFHWYDAQKNPKNCAIRFLTANRTDGGYIHNGGNTGIDGQTEDSAVESWG